MAFVKKKSRFAFYYVRRYADATGMHRKMLPVLKLCSIMVLARDCDEIKEKTKRKNSQQRFSNPVRKLKKATAIC